MTARARWYFGGIPFKMVNTAAPTYTVPPASLPGARASQLTAFRPGPTAPHAADKKPDIPHKNNRLLHPAALISGILLLIAISLYGLATHFGKTISLGGHTTSKQQLEVVIANSVLHVPENMIRFGSQRRAGSHSRLELYLHWPSLSGYSNELSESFNKTNNQTNLIFLSLEPRSMSLDMSGRIKPIYSKFFVGPAQMDVAGLTRQPLSESGGFIDEDLYFEADSPYPFATRCVREGSSFATPYCIRDIHLGRDLMLSYRFHVSHLENWINIDRSIRNVATGMLARE